MCAVYITHAVCRSNIDRSNGFWRFYTVMYVSLVRLMWLSEQKTGWSRRWPRIFPVLFFLLIYISLSLSLYSLSFPLYTLRVFSFSQCPRDEGALTKPHTQVVCFPRLYSSSSSYLFPHISLLSYYFVPLYYVIYYIFLASLFGRPASTDSCNSGSSSQPVVRCCARARVFRGTGCFSI